MQVGDWPHAYDLIRLLQAGQLRMSYVVACFAPALCTLAQQHLKPTLAQILPQGKRHGDLVKLQVCRSFARHPLAYICVCLRVVRVRVVPSFPEAYYAYHTAYSGLASEKIRIFPRTCPYLVKLVFISSAAKAEQKEKKSALVQEVELLCQSLTAESFSDSLLELLEGF